MRMPNVSLVFAVGEQMQFGHNGTLPWPHLKEDLKKFKDVTKGKTLVMGRSTFESLPKKLDGRFHIVLSSTKDVYSRSGESPDVIYDNIEILKSTIKDSPNADFCVIGGPSLLYSFSYIASEVHMTVISCASMPAPAHCDILIDSEFTKHLIMEFNLVSGDKIITKEGLNVIYTHLKR